MRTEKFSTEVAKHLNFYVYRLIDPRNGETFYVGKGKDNRVFAHASMSIDRTDLDSDPKLERIRDIKNAGLDVLHVIHPHGMTDEVAGEVEAALIDAYPGLTNAVGGKGSGDRGCMHIRQVIDCYEAIPAIFQHKCLLITVNDTCTRTDYYRASRYAWKLSPARAAEADYVLAVVKGMIREVFIAEQWLPAIDEVFAGFPTPEGDRYGYVGKPAPQEIQEMYCGRRVPDELRRPGAANPIRYSWNQSAKSAA
jgi:hypothetical protein